MTSRPRPRSLLPTPTPLPIPIQPTPAHLEFLTIYNPALGPTDETLEKQIVFYTSERQKEGNQRLREVGLAQGIVEFARGFSKTKDLSTVLTQQSRLIVKELEPGWWLLSSIALTVLPSAHDATVPEYSPRDLSPPEVLLAQVTDAYEEFVCLHGCFEHGWKNGDGKWAKALERFWRRWAWSWDVLLRGDPAGSFPGVRYGECGDGEDEALKEFWNARRSIEEAKEVLISRYIHTLPGDKDQGGGTTSALTMGLWGKKITPKTDQGEDLPLPSSGLIYTSLEPTSSHLRPLANLVSELHAHPHTAYLLTAGRRKRKQHKGDRAESLSRSAPTNPVLVRVAHGRSASLGPAVHAGSPPALSGSAPSGTGAGIFSYLIPGALNPWGASSAASDQASEAPSPSPSPSENDVPADSPDAATLLPLQVTTLHTGETIRIYSHTITIPSPLVSSSDMHKITTYYTFLLPTPTSPPSTPLLSPPPLLPDSLLPHHPSHSYIYHLSSSPTHLTSTLPPVGSPRWSTLSEGVFLWRMLLKCREGGGGRRKVVVGGVGWWVEWYGADGEGDKGGGGSGGGKGVVRREVG